MKKPIMSSETAKALRENIHEIVKDFEASIRASVDIAERVKSSTLIDHLPEVLENLAVAFEEHEKTGKTDFDKIIRFSREHGRQRAVETDFSLEEVLKEYIILREIILNRVFNSRVISLESSIVFNKFIDKSIQSSVLEYVEIQKQKIKHTISELHSEKEMREKFVAAMSHDLRTPLTAAKMSAQLVMRKPGDVDLALNHLPRVVKNIDRIDGMIQDLLDASVLKSGGGIPLVITECNLEEIVEETITDLIPIHGMRFELKLTHGIIGHWSSTGIQRILENLCNNAVKYGSESEPIIIETSQEPETVRISVKNEGNPLPDDDIDILFNTYQRTSAAKKSGAKGWGIGLMLVKGLVDAHGGKIRVETGTGTNFIIDLPVDSRDFVNSKGEK